MSFPEQKTGSGPPMKLGLPKGRMQDGVFQLLTEAGIEIKVPDRGYRPTMNLTNYQVKLLKPQNVIEMLVSGSRDVGFGGADWVANLDASHILVDLLDTGLDPVKVVAAGPKGMDLDELVKSQKHLLVASEYEKLTKDWIKKKGLNASFVRAFGACECFPPEDADIIVDNTATGTTLKANGLDILDIVFESSTRLYCNPAVLKDSAKKDCVDELVLLLKSAILARQKVMVTFNLGSQSKDELDATLKNIPCMRAPSVSELLHGSGYAVSICAPTKSIALLLPELKKKGASDIIVTKVKQIVQ